MGYGRRGREQYNRCIHQEAATEGRCRSGSPFDSHRARFRLSLRQSIRIMMPISVRMRLTLAYSLILTLTLGLFGAGLFFVMKRSVYAAVDEDLQARLEGVQRLMQRAIPRMSGQELREEFREHSGLRPGGDMLQVWDERGNVVFESYSIGE